MVVYPAFLPIVEARSRQRARVPVLATPERAVFMRKPKNVCSTGDLTFCSSSTKEAEIGSHGFTMSSNHYFLYSHPTPAAFVLS